MEIGFIGLGNMGFPMARRLVEPASARRVRPAQGSARPAGGARRAGGGSPKEVADRADTVLASLPSLQASVAVATGPDGVVDGTRVKRFIDLSTVGASQAAHIHDVLAHAASRRWTARSAAGSAAPRRARWR